MTYTHGRTTESNNMIRIVTNQKLKNIYILFLGPTYSFPKGLMNHFAKLYPPIKRTEVTSRAIIK